VLRCGCSYTARCTTRLRCTWRVVAAEVLQRCCTAGSCWAGASAVLRADMHCSYRSICKGVLQQDTRLGVLQQDTRLQLAEKSTTCTPLIIPRSMFCTPCKRQSDA
jgi:hypothetical protein